jgi:signal transduction histidine kinase
VTRILVIEDDPAILEIVTDTLNYAGYSVITASNGITGLALAQSESPDLILCDIMLPGLDGYGVKLALNQEPRASGAPFIFITARAAREDVRQGMALGADDYLIKPFSARELLNAVHTRLARHQQIADAQTGDLEQLREYINLTLPHELRTPLTGVLGYLAMLRAGIGTLDDTALLDLVGHIEHASLRLNQLIERYVVYAQLRVAASSPELSAALREVGEALPLGMMLRHASEACADEAGRRADLRVEAQPGNAAIVGEHFERLITVLLENAFKFSEPGAPVTVSGQAEPPLYQIVITDRGRGMTTEQIARIGLNVQFERRTWEQQGVGLGLAIAREIVRIYGGRLSLDSAPDAGTTVTVALPLD